MDRFVGVERISCRKKTLNSSLISKRRNWFILTLFIIYSFVYCSYDYLIKLLLPFLIFTLQIFSLMAKTDDLSMFSFVLGVILLPSETEKKFHKNASVTLSWKWKSIDIEDMPQNDRIPIPHKYYVIQKAMKLSLLVTKLRIEMLLENSLLLKSPIKRSPFSSSRFSKLSTHSCWNRSLSQHSCNKNIVWLYKIILSLYFRIIHHKKSQVNFKSTQNFLPLINIHVRYINIKFVEYSYKRVHVHIE